jgi:hypothetical protein
VNLYGTCDVHPADDYVTDVFDKKKKKKGLFSDSNGD